MAPNTCDTRFTVRRDLLPLFVVILVSSRGRGGLGGGIYTASLDFQGAAVAVGNDEFFRIVDALVDAERAEGGQHSSFSVHGKRFGYYWPRTQTVGLKQTMSEQQALVSERPDVFEEQFTSGGFGWVVVDLAGIEVDELSELVFEAWRLSAPAELVAEVTDWAQPT